ncbi:MAG: VOC family protein [Candidatus Hydrogenedentota bacterium]
MSIIRRFDHVSIGVTDIECAKRLFVDVLGGEPLADQGSSSEGFDWFTFRLGGNKMELVTPHAPGQGGVGRYIQGHGEGFHHVSIAVQDLREAIAYFESKGVRVLSPNFEKDAWRHCYLHPKDTFGALIQIFEENGETSGNA